MSAPTEVMPDAGDIKRRLVSPVGLYKAWGTYIKLFGEPPHGTLRQMSSLLALVPGKERK